MILPHSERAGEVSRGVVTNGIGQRSTYHMNLTRSLADKPGQPTAIERARQRAALSDDAYEKTVRSIRKAPYAGAE